MTDTKWIEDEKRAKKYPELTFLISQNDFTITPKFEAKSFLNKATKIASWFVQEWNSVPHHKNFDINDLDDISKKYQLDFFQAQNEDVALGDFVSLINFLTLGPVKYLQYNKKHNSFTSISPQRKEEEYIEKYIKYASQDSKELNETLGSIMGKAVTSQPDWITALKSDDFTFSNITFIYFLKSAQQQIPPISELNAEALFLAKKYCTKVNFEKYCAKRQYQKQEGVGQEFFRTMYFWFVHNLEKEGMRKKIYDKIRKSPTFKEVGNLDQEKENFIKEIAPLGIVKADRTYREKSFKKIKIDPRNCHIVIDRKKSKVNIVANRFFLSKEFNIWLVKQMSYDLLKIAEGKDLSKEQTYDEKKANAKRRDEFLESKCNEELEQLYKKGKITEADLSLFSEALKDISCKEALELSTSIAKAYDLGFTQEQIEQHLIINKQQQLHESDNWMSRTLSDGSTLRFNIFGTVGSKGEPIHTASGFRPDCQAILETPDDYLYFENYEAFVYTLWRSGVDHEGRECYRHMLPIQYWPRDLIKKYNLDKYIQDDNNKTDWDNFIVPDEIKSRIRGGFIINIGAMPQEGIDCFNRDCKRDIYKDHENMNIGRYFISAPDFLNHKTYLNLITKSPDDWTWEKNQEQFIPYITADLEIKLAQYIKLINSKTPIDKMSNFLECSPQLLSFYNSHKDAIIKVINDFHIECMNDKTYDFNKKHNIQFKRF